MRDLWKWVAGGLALGFGAKALSRRGSASARPMVSIPTTRDWGVPFAAPTGRVWPVVGGSQAVPYTTPVGAVVGNSATMFHASREGGTRFHAGVDLQAAPGQRIVAMEDGIVLGLIPGFVGLQTVVVQHPSVVAVYAELAWDTSLPSAGMHVHAGDVIAKGALNSDGRSMLHLELWRTGFAPKGFVPWYSSKPPPAGQLDPTRYLLALS